MKIICLTDNACPALSPLAINLLPKKVCNQLSINSTYLDKHVKTPFQNFNLYSMQQPTCVNLRIRSIDDALKIFTAVKLGLLQKVSRRLNENERLSLCSGCIYVWEGRSIRETASGFGGIERFTEGRKWTSGRPQDVCPPSIFAPRLSQSCHPRTSYFTMSGRHQVLISGILFRFPLC
jgi:hypothetical protein